MSDTAPDFLALCEELADNLTDHCGDNEHSWDLIERARAALATPPPAPPTDEKLDDLWDEVAGYYALYEEAREFGRRAWELGQ